MFGLTVFIANAIVFIVSLAFFIEYASIDMEEALFALIQLAGTGNILYVLLISYILRDKIIAVFESLSKIYEWSKNILKFDLINHFHKIMDILFLYESRRKRWFDAISTTS